METPSYLRVRKHREVIEGKELGHSILPDEIRERISSADRSYRSSNKLEKIDYFEESFNSHFFLYRDESTKKDYLIVNRGYKEESGQTFILSKENFNDLDTAKNEFTSISKKESKRWMTIDHFYRDASKFDVRYINNSKASFGRFSINRFSYLMALSELKTDGYNFEWNGENHVKTGSKHTRKKVQKSLREVRRYVCNLLGNPLLPSFDEANKWHNLLVIFFEKIANDVNEEGFISIKTYQQKSKSLMEMLESLKRYHEVFKGIHFVYDDAKIVMDEICEMYKYNSSEGSGTIIPVGHFKPMGKEQITTLLDEVWDNGRGEREFSALILGLSQMLRPEEFYRLIESPDDYIVDGGLLDYKSMKLVTKTIDKANFDYITNPHLQIVSRLILFHGKFGLDKNFFRKNSSNNVRKVEGLEDVFMRRLRTTGATMLAYCSKIKESAGRASHVDVQTRLCHMSLQMTHNVYARKAPSSKNPKLYFKFDGTINVKNSDGDEVLITKSTSLWDSWLLDIYIGKYMSLFKNKEVEKRTFLEKCLDEAEAYDISVNGEEGDVQGSSY